MRVFDGFAKDIFVWKKIVGPYKKQSYLLFLILCFSAVIETLSVGSVMPLLSAIIESPLDARLSVFSNLTTSVSADTRLLIGSCIVIGLFTLRSLITLVREYFAANFVNSLRHMWSTSMFENYIYGDFQKIKKQKQGHVINLITNEPIFASKGVSAMIDLLIACLVGLVLGIFLLWLNFWITLISFLFVVAGVGLVWKFSASYSEDVGKLRIAHNQMINHTISESVSGIKQIKIFSAEGLVLKEVDGYVKSLMSKMTKFSLFNAFPRAIGELLVIFLIMVALLLGRFLMHLDIASLLPELAVFSIAIVKLFSMGSLFLSKRMEVSTYWPSVIMVQAYASDDSNSEKSDVGDLLLEKISSLSIRDISFGFEDKSKILSGLKMELKSGEMIGLVGSSGSGKSSLCDILTALVPQSSGEIFINNEKLGSINRSVYRKRVGYVSQDTFVFNISIKENIKIAQPAASDQEVINAAKIAQLHSFICELPDGYNTVIGVGGVGLSGGQKQRLALARAFVRKPDILIFDEATSGIDAHMEVEILKSVRKNLSDAITIVVTHRLSGLKHVDHIYCLSGGKISESGTFDELCSQGGKFQSLINHEMS